MAEKEPTSKKKPRKKRAPKKKSFSAAVKSQFIAEANLALAYSLRLDRLANILSCIEPLNEYLEGDIDVLHSVVDFFSMCYGISPEEFYKAKEMLKLYDPEAKCYEA